MLASLTQTENPKMVDKAIIVIILFLRDKVLRKVARKKIVDEIWIKLQSLYTDKSLSHSLCMKHLFYSFLYGGELIYYETTIFFDYFSTTKKNYF